MAKTILAVDDSGSLRQMVAFSLKAAGYEVVQAVDGQDGLNKAKEKTSWFCRGRRKREIGTIILSVRAIKSTNN